MLFSQGGGGVTKRASLLVLGSSGSWGFRVLVEIVLGSQILGAAADLQLASDLPSPTPWGTGRTCFWGWQERVLLSGKGHGADPKQSSVALPDGGKSG